MCYWYGQKYAYNKGVYYLRGPGPTGAESQLIAVIERIGIAKVVFLSMDDESSGGTAQVDIRRLMTREQGMCNLAGNTGNLTGIISIAVDVKSLM